MSCPLRCGLPTYWIFSIMRRIVARRSGSAVTISHGLVATISLFGHGKLIIHILISLLSEKLLERVEWIQMMMLFGRWVEIGIHFLNLLTAIRFLWAHWTISIEIHYWRDCFRLQWANRNISNCSLLISYCVTERINLLNCWTRKFHIYSSFDIQFNRFRYSFFL